MSHSDPQAALLIDADNLSPGGMEQALAHLRGLNLRIPVRRAYGSHDTLGTVREFLLKNSVRAVVNQGKGTTDAALVVDAMDLLHAGSLPRLVAIGSGDADFAPLVVRLREAGMRVMCFAQARKAGDGLDRVYDEVIHVDSPAAPAPAPRKAPVAKKAAAPKPAAKKAAAPKAAEPLPVALRLRQLLDGFAGFSAGRELELNEVVKRLRDEKLMSRSTSARNFFRQHAPEVELFPHDQPNKLRLADGHG